MTFLTILLEAAYEYVIQRGFLLISLVKDHTIDFNDLFIPLNLHLDQREESKMSGIHNGHKIEDKFIIEITPAELI